jgi:transposase-like protein
VPRPGARRVSDRPPYEQLLAEIAATSWSAVGRKYGVSDNAIRKWVRAYERAKDGGEGEHGEPRRVLVLRYRDEETLGRQWAVAQRLQDLPLDARDAGAYVRRFLEQTLDSGEDLEPGAWIR